MIIYTIDYDTTKADYEKSVLNNEELEHKLQIIVIILDVLDAVQCLAHMFI